MKHKLNAAQYFFCCAILFVTFTGLLLYYRNTKEIINVINTDYTAFYTAGLIAKDNKLDLLYDLQTQKQYQDALLIKLAGITYESEYGIMAVRSFRNLPIVAIVMEYLLPLGFTNAYILIFVGLSLLVFLTIWLLGKENKSILFILLVTTFIPTIAGILNTQFTMIVILGLCLYLILLKQKKYLWAGFMLNLFWLKPHFLVMAPLYWALSGFNKKTLMAILIPSILIGILFVPKEYLQFLINSEQISYGTNIYDSYGFQSIIANLGFNNWIASIVITLFTWVLVLFVIWKRKFNDKSIAAISILFPLLIFHSMSPELIFALFSFNYLIKERRWIELFVLYLAPFLAIYDLNYICAIIYLVIGLKLLLEKNQQHV